MVKRKYLRRPPKRGDTRDAQRAIEPVLARVEARWLESEAAAAAYERYLDEDPMAYALGDLAVSLPGVTVLTLDGQP
jgi:hypothetical protein